LLNLPRIKQHLQPTWLLWKLEKPLPLIFWEWRLFCSHSGGILRFSLLLPCGNLRLFATKRSLVVLVVVEFRVMVLDAFKEKVTSFLKEGID
jgi:hypothetical protein